MTSSGLDRADNMNWEERLVGTTKSDATQVDSSTPNHLSGTERFHNRLGDQPEYHYWKRSSPQQGRFNNINIKSRDQNFNVDGDRDGDGNGEMIRSRRFQAFIDRLQGRHLRAKPTLRKSLNATSTASWLNVLFVFVPLSWVSHFLHWNERIIFTLSFLALIPLERMCQFGGHQMTFYLGKAVGDLLVITLMNIVEAILAIILLIKCELRLLQSTVMGVVILQLLLVPGAGFITGGLRTVEQDLHSTVMQLNHVLLTMGVLATLIPAAMFSASQPTSADSVSSYVTDDLRDQFLRFSRGIAFILLVVYISSRIYVFNPPGDDNALTLDEKAPDAAKAYEDKLRKEQPDVSSWFCGLLLVICVGLVAVTAEWLVDSIHFAREDSVISEEWFGLILLPLISFSGDGIITFSYLIRRAIWHTHDVPPSLADARPIDLSIQFALFWIPVLVILAWILNKPLTMLFDLFEVVMLLGSCFLVNYITADSKTNWAEGMTMVCFYAMIALVAWFYQGQEAIEAFVNTSTCTH